MIYTGENTKELIFPLGGIGTGSIGFAGNGRLVDWEIFNRPNKGSDNGYSHFALRVKQGDTVSARVLNGDLLTDYMGQRKNGLYYTGYGFGPAATTMAGFQHFRDWRFDARFPTASLHLSDREFPVTAEISAFNPMIPNDSENSSIPAAFFEITLHNTSLQPLEATVSFAVTNPFEISRNAAVPGGIRLENAGDDPSVPGYGNLAVLASGGEVSVQEYWYRGKWMDGIATYWREMTSPAPLRPRHFDAPGTKDPCTIWVTNTIPAGGEAKVRFVLGWYMPNCYNYWLPLKDDNGRDVTWKNWYATRWDSALDVAQYAMEGWDTLYARTAAFRDALWASTVPAPVIEAAADTLSVLKSPTVLRLEDGALYGWEGVHEKAGSCEGSCTHVWNYAYALCFLFPELERSIREKDFTYNQFPNGAMRFRITLPLGRPGGWEMPCLDGQMGGIIKLYRDWKLCGDDEWLRKLWPACKKSLEFAWSKENPLCWDRDMDGVLEGRQHHTLDMELFGPSSWLEGFYLAALKAGAEMAEHLGETESAALYRDLFRKGSEWTEQNLFNGRWYIQKLDLTDRTPLERYADAFSDINGESPREVYWNPEAGELKYQIGEGSEIDQMCGQWHAALCGLGDIFDPDHRRIALDSMWKNNFKPTMRAFTNPWRNFVLNDEAGTVICDYPQGARKPAIPIPYCEETMHGFEYQYAGLLMAEGRVVEGAQVVKAVRHRYDGKKRNPFNEMECGSNYARSMASFGLLAILGGFTYDLGKGEIGFAPVEKKDYTGFWSVDGAWGTVSVTGTKHTLSVTEGTLRAHIFRFPGLERLASVSVNGVPVSYVFWDGALMLDAKSLTGTLEITLRPVETAHPERFPDGARVCFCGDSITAANDHVARLASYYAEKFPDSGIRFYNCGVSGGNAACAWEYLEDDVFIHRPTHVVFMLGVNDSYRWVLEEGSGDAVYTTIQWAFAEFGKNYRRFCEAVLRYGAKLILCTPPPYAEYMESDTPPLRGGSALMVAYADFVRDYAREIGVPLCDIHSMLTRAVLTRPVFRPDRVHPEPLGHLLMANELLRMQGLEPMEDAPFSQRVQAWRDAIVPLRDIYAAELMIVQSYSLPTEEKLRLVRNYLDTKQYEQKPGMEEFFRNLSLKYLDAKPRQKELLARVDSLTDAGL